MKKLFKLIITTLIVIFIIYIIILYIKTSSTTTFNITSIPIEKEELVINNYYIYGTHLNIEGNISLNYDNIKSISLSLTSDNSLEVPVIVNDDTITLAEHLNNGLYLDGLPIGNYYLLLKVIDNNNSTKYYKLKNNTKNDNSTYYPISVINNTKIFINSNNAYNTIALNVTKNNDTNIYDITLDAGHGGRDTGACYNKKCESTYTYELAKKTEKLLKDKGLKIKLTREDQLSDDEVLAKYNESGRAVIPKESNSKYLFSFHLNSNVSKEFYGLEVLAPTNIDYTLATLLVDNIKKETNIRISNKNAFKIKEGIYTRTFNESEILLSQQEAIEENANAYNITKSTEYYYMIREPGCSITNAYVDGRNEKDGKNPYYASNIGVESYIIELGYIYNSSDMEIIDNKLDEYSIAITNSILQYLNIK
ncbi:MAG: N-acetylmuramoyl-L-alanine amidase [bacterium]|nr:N-acetylmuramoyl-L-alanine amidase [bacterium]